MLDKGFTRAAFRKIKKIMPDEFSLLSVGANSGMAARGIRYGVLERLGTGRYKVKDGIKDPWAVYQSRTEEIKKQGKRGSRALAIIQPAPRPDPRVRTEGGPRVSIASYIGEQKLIVVGKQVFLGIEVALVPKGGD